MASHGAKLVKQNSRGNAIIPTEGSRNGSKGQVLDGGFKISAVQIISGKGREKSMVDANYEIYDTRMKVVLPRPLKAKGGELSLKIDFSFLSPQYGSDRMGILQTPKGKVYTIAQWYPRMCVYDDISGWNNLPHSRARRILSRIWGFQHKHYGPKRPYCCLFW